MNPRARRPIGRIAAVVFALHAASLLSCGGGGGDVDDPADVTPPTVLATTPARDATDVAVDALVTATFSEAMDTASIDATSFNLKHGANDSAVAGTITLSGTTATFSPHAHLAHGARYTATITTGARDLAGRSMAADYSYTFTTRAAPDVTPPTVTSSFPADGARDVALDVTVSATFSESIDCATIAGSSFTLTEERGNAMAGSVGCSGTTATFTPATRLAHARRYTAKLSRTIGDPAANVLQSDRSWTFTTATAFFAIRLGSLPLSFYTFDTSAPDAPTLLGSGTIPGYAYALGFDRAGQTLYAMDTWSNLGTIDEATGAYTALGTVTGILANHNVDGLAADPATGTIYLVSNNGFTGASALYSLDPVTLAASLLGTQSAAKYLVELAFDSSSNLYTVSIDTDSLYRIDKLNGQLTLVGPLGRNVSSQQGIAFDPSSGVLYGVVGDLGQYAFGTIDTATGAFTGEAMADSSSAWKIAIAPVR